MYDEGDFLNANTAKTSTGTDLRCSDLAISISPRIVQNLNTVIKKKLLMETALYGKKNIGPQGCFMSLFMEQKGTDLIPTIIRGTTTVP